MSDSQDANLKLPEFIGELFKYENDMPKEKAFQLCSSHLKGSWSSASMDDIDVSIIMAGFINRIFHITKKNKDGSHDHCIIRLYGGKFIDPSGNALRMIGYQGEVLIFYLMGQANIGPKLLSVFDGGRIEEFLEHYTTLTNEDVKDANVISCLAKKFVQMHLSDVPLCKEARKYFEFIDKTFITDLDDYKKSLNSDEMRSQDTNSDAKTTQEAYELFNSFDFQGHVETLKQLVQRVKSPLVLTHNDTNRANFMINRKHSVVTVDSIRILDYEFTGYSYRGADFGSFFQNSRLDIAEMFKGNFVPMTPYPDVEERRHFLKSYLEGLQDSGVQLDPQIDTVEHMLVEAELYGGLHQMFFFTCMMHDSKKREEASVHKKVQFNPIVMVASHIKDWIDRKKETLDLLDKFSL